MARSTTRNPNRKDPKTAIKDKIHIVKIKLSRICLKSLPITVFVASLRVCAVAHAERPEIYIWDVLNRPNYRAAYTAMVRHSGPLPGWMATPEALSHVTTGAGDMVKIAGEQDGEGFSMCRAHYCNEDGMAIIFQRHGDRVMAAVGLQRGPVRFLGNPSKSEEAALMELLPPG